MRSSNSLTTVPAVILAAGEGRRVRAQEPREAFRVGARPIVARVADAMRGAGITRILAVVGHRASDLRAAIGTGVEYVVQDQQLGTGHATHCAQAALAGYRGPVIVAYGDIPLLTADDVARLVSHHLRSQSDATMLTAVLPNPATLGRITRGPDGSVYGIVEARDASEEQLAIEEINVGVYCFEAPLLFELLPELKNDNAQAQYYLTDVIGLLASRGHRVAATPLERDSALIAASYALAAVAGRLQAVALLGDGAYSLTEGGERVNAFLHYVVGGTVSRVTAAVEELEWLVNREATTEAELQAFFEKHPQFLLGSDYRTLHPQVVLHRDEEGPLIPDFLVEPVAAPLLCDVLDLKRPRERVVTRNGGRLVFAKSVLRAAAQLRQYQDYFDSPQHRERVLSRYGISAYRPSTAVIIGRDPVDVDSYDLQDVRRDIPGLKVLTYDDIVKRGKHLLSRLTQ